MTFVPLLDTETREKHIIVSINIAKHIIVSIIK
jgi:hypothetical protein